MPDKIITSVLPPSVMRLCDTLSRIPTLMEPILKSSVVCNSSLQPLMKSVAMKNRSLASLGQAVTEMNRSLLPLGKVATVMNNSLYHRSHTVGAIMRSEAFAGVGAVMRSSSVLQVGEAVRGMTAVGAALNTVIGDSAVKEFRTVTESLRLVDWNTVIENLEVEAEEEERAELKEETVAAASFLTEEMQGILDEVEQSPQGLIAALVSLHEKVAESTLGKIAKYLVIRLLNIMIDGLVFTFILSLGGASQQPQMSHRETLKDTKRYVLNEAGYHPQLRIVSVKNRLNIRMKPNKKSYVVGKLYPYTVVTVIGHAGKWARICFANGQDEAVEGWVFNKYLSKLKR